MDIHIKNKNNLREKPTSTYPHKVLVSFDEKAYKKLLALVDKKGLKPASLIRTMIMEQLENIS